MKLVILPALAGVLGSLLTAPAALAEPSGMSWHKCQLNVGDELGAELDKAGVQCAELKVPLDYSKPGGDKLTLAISRLPAKRDRIGAMLLNDGGPGGPGIQMPPGIRTAMKDVGDRYDLIGMDPRGIGRSTPLDCGWPVSSSLWSAGLTRASFDQTTALMKDLADRCAAQRDYLPHLSTQNTARDMDRVRIALGEQKISYLGYSYGSYLGAMYAELFPGRTDRLVLDGPLAPNGYGPRFFAQVGPANEAALRDWAGWAAQRHRTYQLGRTARQVLANVTRAHQVAAGPGLAIGRWKVTDRLVPLLLLSMLDDDRAPARRRLAELVQTLHRATSGPVTNPPEDVATLIGEMNGSTYAQYGAAQSAIICASGPAPSDPEVYWQDIEKHRKTEPFFGALTRNLEPCAFWPADPAPSVEVDTAVPALIVAADGDPRTTYPNAAKLQQAVKGSRVLTLRNARVHGVFGEYGNVCVDRKVNAYLASGELPAKDSSCDGRSPERDLANVAQPLSTLSDQVGAAKVVGIGEATHSSHEFFTFKHRAFEELVERKGFTTFALESPWSTGLALDRYVVTGEGDPREILRREYQDSYRLWNTEEYLALIEWMRSYNKSHARKVRFMGDDLGYVGPEVPDRVVAYVRKVRPELAAAVTRWYAAIRSTAEVKEWTERYFAKSLADRRKLEVDARKALHLVSSLPGGREQRWAEQHARNVWQVAKIYSFDLADPELAPKAMLFRDRVMAENVAWWVNETGSKTVLSAHNGHIGTEAYDPDYPKLQGQFLREEFGPEYLAVGTTFTQGSFNAYDSQDPARPLRVVTLGQPPQGSNDEVLAAVPGDYLVDLRNLPPVAAHWIRADRLTREYGTDYPVEESHLSLKKSFDLLVHHDRITAAHLRPGT